MAGARPLRRALQRHVENALAKRVLQGEFHADHVVVVDADASGIVFRKQVEEASVEAWWPMPAGAWLSW